MANDKGDTMQYELNTELKAHSGLAVMNVLYTTEFWDITIYHTGEVINFPRAQMSVEAFHLIVDGIHDKLKHLALESTCQENPNILVRNGKINLGKLRGIEADTVAGQVGVWLFEKFWPVTAQGNLA
jgi:hypothetical protein